MKTDSSARSRPGYDAPDGAASAGAEPSSRVRNHTTPEGAELGKHLARFCDEAEPKARLRMPELPPRCNSCAFRAGPHVASGSPQTQMDALKCIMEGIEFQCHEPAREGHLCSGWAMMMLAKDGPDFTNLPWSFSDEPDADTSGANDPPRDALK